MWEIIKKLNGKTLWEGRDCEGRRIYAVSINRGNVPEEPTGTSIFYSKNAALNSIE